MYGRVPWELPCSKTSEVQHILVLTLVTVRIVYFQSSNAGNGSESMLAAGLVGCSSKLKPWMWVSLYGRRLHLKWVCSMNIMRLSWTVLFVMHWMCRVEMEGGGRIIKHWHPVLQEYLSVTCQVLCEFQMTLRSDVATVIANLKICWILGCIFWSLKKSIYKL